MRVLFVHYRVGERDGVSIEIEKRAKIFKELGHEVFFLSGYDGISRKNSWVFPEVNILDPQQQERRLNFFERFVWTLEEAEKEFQDEYTSLTEKIRGVFAIVQPDLVCVHNVYSHAYQLPFTFALMTVQDEFAAKTLTVHHDFWFDRPRFTNSTYSFIREKVEQIPFDRPYIFKQQVINSIAQKALLDKRGISAERIGDFFDFSKEHRTREADCNQLRTELNINTKDFVILHATRIIERKAIEIAIEYASQLQSKFSQLTEPVVLNGKIVTKDTKVKILFSNFVEVDADVYVIKLKELALNKGVELIWGAARFTLYEEEGKFSFWDSYALASLVTYTSVAEGFGNQFLEAMYFKKPLVMLEYPVFVDDIKQEGYHYISLGSKFKEEENKLFSIPSENMQTAVQFTFGFLENSSELIKNLELNFNTAKKYHDASILAEELFHLCRQLAAD